MARMDLRLRRDAPGISVFWIILIVGVAVFVLLAIVLMSGNPVTQPVTPQVEHEITAGEGDEVPGATSFSAGEVAEEGPTEPAQIPGEAGELDEAAPDTDAPADTEAEGTVGAVGAEPAASAEEPAEGQVETEDAVSGGEAEALGAPFQSETEEDLVTDPDRPEAAPVDPTPAGPEGRDDDALTED